ncbi:hypothetical protein V6N98_000248 [Campylobacter upsaliensis]
MNLKLNTALRDGLGFRCSKFNGVIWLNAEHLGGVPLAFESCRGGLVRPMKVNKKGKENVFKLCF